MQSSLTQHDTIIVLYLYQMDNDFLAVSSFRIGMGEMLHDNF